MLHNVSKRYRQVVALDNVSLSIEPGEIFGYIGPNGAGKTTTIRILVGLITDFQGQVTIAGQSRAAIRGRLQKILGYLPQEVGFQEWRTVEHALTTFGLLSGLSDSQLQRRIAEVLDLLYLTPVRRKTIAHLSGGMVQKLGLAQALLHNPPLLVLDEPLAGLDPASRHHVIGCWWA